MKVAVLMSTYNGHKYLDEQLKSIAQQTVVNILTLYIRDDGSKDDTFDIINKWKNKISIVLYKEKNAGPAMSFWQLLMKSEVKADYYAFCDQDDVWDKDKLERGIEKLKGNIQLYACNCRIIDENGIVIKKNRVSGSPNMNVQKLFISGCTQGCSMIFTDTLRNYVKNLKITCIPMHDVVLMLYAKYLGKIYWDANPHFGYRVHANNVVAKSNKSVFEQIKTTIWNWENSKTNSMSSVASEMLSNVPNIPASDKIFLQRISEYQKHRLWLLKNATKNIENNRALRSYVIRIIIGMY